MPYVQVRLTPRLERVFDVARGATIGRAPDSTVQILSRAVSRKHAVIEPRPGGLHVKDLGAGNGVKVNGQKIAGPTPLQDGDTILVGDVSMTFKEGTLAVSASETIDLRGSWLTQELIDQAVARRPVGFVIFASTQQVDTFQSQIARVLIQRLDFSEDEKFKLQIALAEAIDNSVRHAYKSDATKPLQIAFDENDEEFMMTVRDLGEGYDVDAIAGQAEPIDAIQALRDRATLGEGLGLRIILDCVDRLQFEGKGACLHMSKLKAAGDMIVISSDEVEPGAPPDEPEVPPDELEVPPGELG